MSKKTDVVEKDSSKIYFLFTSIMMLVPPLSLGFTSIFFNNNNFNLDIVGLIMNYSAILAIVIIGSLLVGSSKIDKPKTKDIMLLLFGLLSNIVIYLFAFQAYLKIDDYIDIYISTISILLLYFIFVNKKYFNYELSILSILFFAFYRFHMGYVYNNLKETTVLIKMIYVLVPLIVLGISSLKIYKYKIIDWFSGTFIFLSAISLSYLINSISFNNKLFLTIFLILPFVMILDFIVSKINTSFNMNKIPFYMRMGTLVMLIVIFKTTNYFNTSSYMRENLYQYTFIMFSLIFINIIEGFIESINKVVEVDKKVKNNVNDYPKWLGESIIEEDINKLNRVDLKDFLKKYNLHDSKWIKLVNNPNYTQDVMLIINLNSSKNKYCPLLFIKIKEVNKIEYINYCKDINMDRIISVAYIREDGKLVIEDKFDGMIEITYSGDTSVLLLDGDKNVVDLIQ